MKEYRKRKKINVIYVSQSESDIKKQMNSLSSDNPDIKIMHRAPDKEVYLSQFESRRNGPIHDQKWVIKNMQDFHNSMKFKIYRCEICIEAWPLSTKSKKKVPYICSRCVCDKNTVK